MSHFVSGHRSAASLKDVFHTHRLGIPRSWSQIVFPVAGLRADALDPPVPRRTVIVVSSVVLVNSGSERERVPQRHDMGELLFAARAYFRRAPFLLKSRYKNTKGGSDLFSYLVIKTGPVLLSMRDIAHRAGVSVGTVSYHFNDKELLLEEVLDEYYRKLDAFWEQAETQLTAGPFTVDKAKNIVEQLFTMLHSQRNLVRLRLMLSVQMGAVPERRHHEHLGRYVDAIASSFVRVPHPELSIRVYSIFLLVTRHAAMHKREWKLLVAEENDEAVEKAVQRRVVDMCVDLLPIAQMG